MASRAHVIHDYSYGRRSERPRHDVWYREEDPVVLPRASVWSSSGGLILAALAMGGLIAGSAYTALHRPASEPVLAETPTPPLVAPDFQLDPEIQRARVTNMLSGPAYAVIEKGEAIAEPDEGAASLEAASSSPPAIVAGKQHMTVDDASSRTPDASPAAPKEPSTDTGTGADLQSLPHAPYPNPTITPPDAVAPPDAAPDTPTPVLGPDSERPPQENSGTTPDSKQPEESQ